MIAKRSTLAAFLFVVSLICIILKLLISYLFPYSRLILWFIIIPVILICLIIFIIKNRKTLWNKRVLQCSLLSLAAVVFALLPIDRQLELARFQVSKGLYNAAAQETQKEISSFEDTDYARHNLKKPYSMLIPYRGCVYYYKNGNSVAILFPASSSLSITRSFVYYSDEKARAFTKDFQKTEELDGSQWAYVFTWGKGDMTPKDPNL